MRKRTYTTQLLALILALAWQLACLPHVQAFPSSPKSSDINKLHQSALVCVASTYITLSEGGHPEIGKTSGVIKTARFGYSDFDESWRVAQRLSTECAQRAHKSTQLWLLYRTLLL